MFQKCRKCNGYGYYVIGDTSLGFTCKTCGGRGGFDVPDGMELCPNCHGRGVVTIRAVLWGINHEEQCKKCNGTGFVDKIDKAAE